MDCDETCTYRVPVELKEELDPLDPKVVRGH